MIKPKEVEITGLDGETRTFVIHRLPATVGREVVAKYPISSLPKLGDYEVNEEVSYKMLAYVGVKLDSSDPNKLTMLRTKALVDNHVTDWQMLGKLEMAMLEYNTNFLASGKASELLSGLKTEVTEWISKTLTDSLERYSRQEKPRSKNSKKTTRSKTR
jgi:hypothetical protein